MSFVIPSKHDTRGRIKDDVEARLLVQTVLFILVLVVMLALINSIRENVRGTVDLTFLMVAFSAAAISVYAGTTAHLLFRGRLSRPLGESMYVMAPALCFFFMGALRPDPYPEALSFLALPALVVGLMAAGGSFTRGDRGQWWFLVRGTSLVMLGVVVFFLSPGAGASTLEGSLLKALMISGLLSLLALLGQHTNPSLRRLGEAFVSDARVAGLTIALVAFFVYVDSVRPALIREGSDLMAVAEWGLVAGAVLLFAFALLRMNFQRMAGPSEPDWRSSFRNILVHDSDLVRATRAVERFVKDGQKEELLIMMVAALQANHVPEGEVAEVIQKVVRYQKEDVPLALAWTYGDLEKRERDRRMSIVAQALGAASAKVGLAVPRIVQERS